MEDQYVTREIGF